MTPKDKAKELYEKYCNMNSHCDNAIECSLIAVDEVLNVLFQHHKIDYWKEVKEQIVNL
jgi:hypothetical protein